MRILVCEDSPIALKTIEYTLRKGGYQVLNAIDGEQGIDILNNEPVDLVITDINMPFNNGLELVQHIRRNLEKKIPVIIISGITLEETKKHARELGAEGYLTKPFDPGTLLEMVHSLTSNP